MIGIKSFWVLLEDRKGTLNIGDNKSNVHRIMCFFSDFKDTHLERREYNKQYYQELGWMTEEYFDVINSFWTIFKCALIECVHTDERFTKYKKNYRFSNTGVPLVPGGKQTHQAIVSGRKMEVLGFPDRYKTYKTNSDLSQIVEATEDKYTALNDLASCCHCVANFSPCPALFNSAKGIMHSVYDFMPLMVNWIELHSGKISESKTQIVCDNGDSLSCEEVESWKKWLIDNREAYCLEEYYCVFSDEQDPTQKHIKGTPFFERQSLEHPLPTNEAEVRECINEMVVRIKNRAHRLYNQYLTNTEVNSETCNT